MELDILNNGELIVHYSHNLVTLIREVWLLKEFGYLIPSALMKLLMKYLKQNQIKII